jgi:hypothetical protein
MDKKSPKWGVKHNIIFLIVIASLFLYSNIRTFNGVPISLLLPLWSEILGYIVTIIIIWVYRKSLKEDKLQKACFCLFVGFAFGGLKRLIVTQPFTIKLLSGIGIFFSTIAIIITVSFLLQSKHEH